MMTTGGEKREREAAMFGMSGTEIAIILILALLLLGPSKLPELARGLGKGLRELRRATDDVRTTVEREFYRMDLPPPPAVPSAPEVPRTPAPSASEGGSSTTAPPAAPLPPAARALSEQVPASSQAPEPPKKDA